MDGVPGSHHPQFIDVLQCDHATVETDGVRTGKAMGLRSLPSKTWQVNKGRILSANIAADLTAWARLLGFHDQKPRGAAGAGAGKAGPASAATRSGDLRGWLADRDMILRSLLGEPCVRCVAPRLWTQDRVARPTRRGPQVPERRFPWSEP
jgi:hypothetical protein